MSSRLVQEIESRESKNETPLAIKNRVPHNRLCQEQSFKKFQLRRVIENAEIRLESSDSGHCLVDNFKIDDPLSN